MKHIICLVLTVIMLMASTTGFAKARTYKKKKNYALQSRSYTKIKGKKKRISKTSRYKRVKKSGNGPDLKALTTTSPYTENPANGVNPVETKPGI